MSAKKDGVGNPLESYSYDAQGRRTSGNGLAYTYNDDDQLLAMGGTVAYDYTDNGYRAHRYEGDSCIGYEYTTTGQLKRVAHYDYNAEGEGSWELDPLEHVITYQLDAAGRRVAKLVDNVVQEKYLWAGHNTTLLAIYDGSDNLVARFEYGVGRMPLRMTQGTETYYFAYDQVGSLRAVFDDAGSLVHEITYDSYGNIITDETTSGFESVYIPPFGFAGGLHDRDTGIVLFGFRDYDPETGTWLTPDPIGFAGGDTYLYSYCGGDPVNRVDSNGLIYDPGLGLFRDHPVIDDGIVESINGLFAFMAAFQYVHYNRNWFNAPAPPTANDANPKYLAGYSSSMYHKHGRKGDRNQKFIYPDGSEYVYDYLKNLDITPENMGTFNFGKDPVSQEHFFYDMLPYWIWANSPDDTTPWYDRIYPINQMPRPNMLPTTAHLGCF